MAQTVGDRDRAGRDADGQLARIPAEVAALEGRARRQVTRHGDGDVLWRRWGSGPPLILLHGGSGSWMHWLRNIDTLSRAFDVVVPDMPGFGGSGNFPHDLQPVTIAGILASGLPQVLGPSARPRIAGFSFGSNVGAELASMLGDGASGFVIVSGGRGLGLPYAPLEPLVRWRRLADPAERLQAHRRNLEIMMLANPSSVDATAVFVQSRSAEGTVLRYRRPDEDVRLSKAIANLSCPVGGIWGASDRMIGGMLEERRLALTALHLSARCDFVPNAGHWVQYEAAQAFNALLQAHLA